MVIVKRGGKHCLLSRKTQRNLGCYPTREGAEQREREVQYFKHAGKRPEVHVRRHAREIVADRRPPMAKRITRDDATPILNELQRIDNDALVYSKLVGSVAKRGHSEKDLDIMVAIDPSRVGVEVHDLDEFYDWLGSEEGSGLEVVRAIHSAMERAGATFYPGSDPDPESWILVRRKRSVPVDLWYTWSTPEMEKAGEEELRRLKEMIERG